MIQLPEEQARQILNYLEGRPLREVEAGVAWLRAAIAASTGTRPLQPASGQPERDKWSGQLTGGVQP
jgi:hypothetical protein